jgi:hypothetical protein
MVAQTDTYMQKFKATLFTIAKDWKAHHCPSTKDGQAGVAWR